MIKAPCKDCPDRHQNCHSECDKYKAFSDERKRLCQLKNEDSIKHSYEYKRSWDIQNRRNKKNWK